MNRSLAALCLALTVAPATLGSIEVAYSFPPPPPPHENSGGAPEPSNKGARVKPRNGDEAAAVGEMENDPKSFKRAPKATLTREQANEFTDQKKNAATSKKKAESDLKSVQADLVKDYANAERLKKPRDDSQDNLNRLEGEWNAAKTKKGTSAQADADISNRELVYKLAKAKHDTGAGAEYDGAVTALEKTATRLRAANADLKASNEEIEAVVQRRLVTQRANYLANKRAKQSIYGPAPKFPAAAVQNIYGAAPAPAANNGIYGPAPPPSEYAQMPGPPGRGRAAPGQPN